MKLRLKSQLSMENLWTPERNNCPLNILIIPEPKILVFEDNWGE